MIRQKGRCVRCNKTTWNSKSGLCRKHWEERVWGKDEEYSIVYPNGKIDGALANNIGKGKK